MPYNEPVMVPASTVVARINGRFASLEDECTALVAEMQRSPRQPAASHASLAPLQKQVSAVREGIHALTPNGGTALQDLSTLVNALRTMQERHEATVEKTKAALMSYGMAAEDPSSGASESIGIASPPAATMPPASDFLEPTRSSFSPSMGLDELGISSASLAALNGTVQQASLGTAARPPPPPPAAPPMAASSVTAPSAVAAPLVVAAPPAVAAIAPLIQLDGDDDVAAPLHLRAAAASSSSLVDISPSPGQRVPPPARAGASLQAQLAPPLPVPSVAMAPPVVSPVRPPVAAAASELRAVAPSPTLASPPLLASPPRSLAFLNATAGLNAAPMASTSVASPPPPPPPPPPPSQCPPPPLSPPPPPLPAEPSGDNLYPLMDSLSEAEYHAAPSYLTSQVGARLPECPRAFLRAVCLQSKHLTGTIPIPMPIPIALCLPRLLPAAGHATRSRQ